MRERALRERKRERMISLSLSPPLLSKFALPRIAVLKIQHDKACGVRLMRREKGGGGERVGEGEGDKKREEGRE